MKTTVVIFAFLLCLCQFKETEATDCAFFLSNQTVSWMAVYHNYVSAGTAFYAPNGSFVTWDPQGNLINEGTYKIWEENGWCYELETYTYPPDGSDTCNTFQICESSNSMVGCEVFGDECYPSCETEAEWVNWYAARIVPKTA
eukprot:CAMPEP_0168553310 /NCGR_PEP_ID=MMETSP0413-20121227/7184_1 /TAXON_ID=136452 /ORGANISM="Filamoeba nolandi, Strain NC-AS-23-1" /LENGTH=142 /DNA_ID=CAMNT_0008583987 /DNA_START=37 /DNA_END=465 /DNA_ORIENTATION=+